MESRCTEMGGVAELQTLALAVIFLCTLESMLCYEDSDHVLLFRGRVVERVDAPPIQEDSIDRYPEVHVMLTPRPRSAPCTAACWPREDARAVGLARDERDRRLCHPAEVGPDCRTGTPQHRPLVIHPHTDPVQGSERISAGLIQNKDGFWIIPEASRALHVRCLHDVEQGAHGFLRHWFDDDHFLS